MLRSPITTTYLVKDNNCEKTLVSSVKQIFASVDGDLYTLIANLECLHNIRQQDTSNKQQLFSISIHNACLLTDKDSEIKTSDHSFPNNMSIHHTTKVPKHYKIRVTTIAYSRSTLAGFCAPVFDQKLLLAHIKCALCLTTGGPI